MISAARERPRIIEQDSKLSRSGFGTMCTGAAYGQSLRGFILSVGCARASQLENLSKDYLSERRQGRWEVVSMLPFANPHRSWSVKLWAGLGLFLVATILASGSNGTTDLPPSWGSLPLFHAFEGVPLTLDLSPYIIDADTPVDGLCLGCNGSGGATISRLNATFTFAAPGNATVLIYLTDGVNVVPGSLNFTVAVANQPPRIKVVQLPDGEEDECYSFNLTATDPDDLESELVWSDDSPMFRISATGEIAFLPGERDAGYQEFNVTVTDPGGESDTVRFTLFINRISHPPTIIYIGPQTAIPYEVFTLDVSKYVIDPDLLIPEQWRGHLTYRDDSPKLDTDFETGIVTWDTPTNRDVGDNYFKITVTDSCGRYAEQEIKITVISISVDHPLDIGPERRVDQGEVFELHVLKPEDAHGGTVYQWSYEDGGATHYLTGECVNVSLHDAGTTEVTCTATLDGMSSSRILTVHVRDTERPITVIRTNATVRMHETVRFDGTGSTDNVGITAFQWRIDDGAGQAVLIGPVVRHEFDRAGRYLILLEVEDAMGHTASDMASILVLDTEPPIAEAGADIYVQFGIPIVLDGRNSTDNLGIEGYMWGVAGYGSGRAFGPVVVLDLLPPGDHTVKLTVRDAVGNVAVDEVTVSVVQEEEKTREAPTAIARGFLVVAIIAILMLTIIILMMMISSRHA
jgi:hypothetical protein